MKSFLKAELQFRNGFKDPKRLKQIHDLPCLVCEARGIDQISKTIAHHKIGNGLGLKASDRLTMAICENHHNKSSDGIHNSILGEWEEKNFTQEKLIKMTDKRLLQLKSRYLKRKSH